MSDERRERSDSEDGAWCWTWRAGCPRAPRPVKFIITPGLIIFPFFLSHPDLSLSRLAPLPHFIQLHVCICICYVICMFVVVFLCACCCIGCFVVACCCCTCVVGTRQVTSSRPHRGIRRRLAPARTRPESWA